MHAFSEEYDLAYPFQFWLVNGEGGHRVKRLLETADVAFKQLHVVSTGIPLKLAKGASVSLLTAG